MPECVSWKLLIHTRHSTAPPVSQARWIGKRPYFTGHVWSFASILHRGRGAGFTPNASRLLQCLWYICHMTGMGFHWSCPTGNWSHIFPFCLQKGSEEGSSCEVIDDKTEATAYSVAVLICVFGIPVLVMTPMYWKIFIVLWKSSKTSKAMQKWVNSTVHWKASVTFSSLHNGRWSQKAPLRLCIIISELFFYINI